MKQFFTIACCLFIAVNTFGATSYTITGSGDDLTLTITGTGNMPNYSWSGYDAPWNSQGYYIKILIIEDGVTHIGNSAFANCSGLISVMIPNSVTSIGDAAFLGCNDLTSLTIPNSVTSIGYYAFGSCWRLTSITIPNSVTTIGDDAFSYCTGLISIDVANDNPNYTSENGILFDKAKTTLINYPASKTGTDYVFPNSVTAIGEYAFYGCNLTSLRIPNSIISIGDYAFEECSGLTGTLTIPNSVTTIGDLAFSGCTGLTGALTIPNSVTDIGALAFSGCVGLTSVTFGNSLTAIDRAFSGCTGLTSITFGNSMDLIGDGAFSGCTGLTGTLTIPNSVTTIGQEAFSGCTGLTSLTIPNSVTYIEYGAFANCTDLMEINSQNTTPPIAWGWNTFDGIDMKACILYVPTGCTDIYRSDFYGWEGFFNIQEKDFGQPQMVETLRSTSLQVYPNPAKDYLFIQSESPVKKIEIYNQSGVCVLINDNVTDKIDVSSLVNGIYFARIYIDGTPLTRKIIVENN